MKTHLTPSSNQIFGHPKGLFYLFFAELWERFSFYGMRAMLILYMTDQLLYSDKMSFGIYAAYGSLVYATPLIGGMLADKILGYEKAIILGGILMALGHFCLAIETPIFFYLSLGLICVGNGLFKPNISSFVGSLYAQGDKRRDAGFTLFYLGINLGGMIAPFLCAWVAATYGWHYGFALAGIGMLIGLAVFFTGVRNDIFEGKGEMPDEELYQHRSFGLNQGQLITVLAFICAPIFALLINGYAYEHYLIWIVLIIVIVLLARIMFAVEKLERQRLWVVGYFTLLASLFWAVFEQSGSSITLFSARNVDLIGINASQTNGINSTFIVLLAIPFSALWAFLSDKKYNPSSPLKFGIGLLLVGLSFVVLSISGIHANELAQTPMFYLILAYFILTLGEMFISPIGLSKMSELAPLKYVSFIMGVWFLSSFFGHFIAGKIAQFTSIEEGKPNLFSEGFIGNIIDSITGISYPSAQASGEGFIQLQSYVSSFAGFGLVILLLSFIVIAISPFIKRLMPGVQ